MVGCVFGLLMWCWVVFDCVIIVVLWGVYVYCGLFCDVVLLYCGVLC